MSNLFSKPKSPKLPEQEKIEEVQKVEETAEEASRREKKRLALQTGRSSTLLTGIQAALKKRLGE